MLKAAEYSGLLLINNLLTAAGDYGLKRVNRCYLSEKGVNNIYHKEKSGL